MMYKKAPLFFSILESCQISQNFDIMKEKENKKFFSFFQRSKKKRDQVSISLLIIL